MRTTLALAAGVLVLASLAEGAARPRPFAIAAPFDISGKYDSNWGEVTLVQHGTHVTDTYVYDHGTLDGTLDGNF